MPTPSAIGNPKRGNLDWPACTINEGGPQEGLIPIPAGAGDSRCAPPVRRENARLGNAHRPRPHQTSDPNGKNLDQRSAICTLLGLSEFGTRVNSFINR
jgi:hypothetical protein